MLLVLLSSPILLLVRMGSKEELNFYKKKGKTCEVKKQGSFYCQIRE